MRDKVTNKTVSTDHNLSEEKGEPKRYRTDVLPLTMYDDDVPLAEFIYLEFTRMPGRSYRRRLGSLVVCLCDVFRALINSLGFWFCTCALGLVLFEIVNKNRQYITHTNYTSH